MFLLTFDIIENSGLRYRLFLLTVDICLCYKYLNLVYYCVISFFIVNFAMSNLKSSQRLNMSDRDFERRIDAMLRDEEMSENSFEESVVIL